MQDITKQVTSLELSKQLKEAGYEQEGVWWWVGFTSGYQLQYQTVRNKFIPEEKHYVAPTVAELGERLPEKHIMFKIQDKFWVEYQGSSPCKSFVADTEANVRAKMWLYLKKEGLLCKT